jgi:hypothetical protein
MRQDLVISNGPDPKRPDPIRPHVHTGVNPPEEVDDAEALRPLCHRNRLAEFERGLLAILLQAAECLRGKR